MCRQRGSVEWFTRVSRVVREPRPSILALKLNRPDYGPRSIVPRNQILPCLPRPLPLRKLQKIQKTRMNLGIGDPKTRSEALSANKACAPQLLEQKIVEKCADACSAAPLRLSHAGTACTTATCSQIPGPDDRDEKAYHSRVN